MGRYKAKLIDKNRYCKRYPYIRAPKRLTYQGSSDMALELGTIVFNNQSSGSFTFEIPFDDINYNVVAVPKDTTADDSAQVNIHVDKANSSRHQVTVLASAPFTGEVDIIAIRIV